VHNEKYLIPDELNNLLKKLDKDDGIYKKMIISYKDL
jgi:hypothetical protein